MNTINLTEKTDLAFIDDFKKESGQDPALCYQCGNCTAGCPYSDYFDYPVSQIMRLLQAGQKETILNSKAIWLCATCTACTTRCPCNIDVAHIMDVLRIISRKENCVAEKDIKKFYDTFLSSMRMFGRIYEIGIVMMYKLRAFSPFGDLDLGPQMFLHRKIGLFPKFVQARKTAAIFRKFRKQQKQKERAKKNGR